MEMIKTSKYGYKMNLQESINALQYKLHDTNRAGWSQHTSGISRDDDNGNWNEFPKVSVFLKTKQVC